MHGGGRGGVWHWGRHWETDGFKVQAGTLLEERQVSCIPREGAALAVAGAKSEGWGM